MLTDEEVSELAECLEDACQKSAYPVGRGHICRSSNTCCPMGALIGEGWVSPLGVANRTDIDAHDARSFIEGYDRGRSAFCPTGADPRLFALGQQFRERYP